MDGRFRHLATPSDLVLTLVLAGAAVVQTFAAGGEQPLLRSVLVALTVSGIAVRRTAPASSGAWIAAGLAATSLITESPDQVGVLLAVIVSAFSVAAWAPLRDAAMGLGLLALAVSLSIAVDPSDDLGNIAPTLLLFLAVPAGLGLAFNRRGRTLAELTARTAELERQAEQAVETERRRIARELHDVVSHAVTLIAVQAEAGQAVLDDDPEAARRSLAAISTASRDALAELHSLLGLLRKHDESEGPAPGLSSLPTLVAGVRAAGLEVELLQDGPPPRLDPEADLCAYRVVQEGLTNALRHSRQPDVRVRVEAHPSTVRIDVESFGPAHQSSYGGSGRGLEGLRARVLDLGGTFTSGQPHEQAWSLNVTLPRVPA